ncbi:hypothetical protein [Marinomonas sp. THO17]|uniref:hypothetical protein n=1 Tax=Marinomonas sp. THO17 TaxID=3149048 RepID=UPI00336C16C2
MFYSLSNAVCLVFMSMLLSGVVVAAQGSTPSSAFGQAYSLESGELLYTERHQALPNRQHSVVYAEPDGQVFARKQIDFSQSLIRPSFQQLNQRNGEYIKVAQQGDSFLVSYRESTDTEEETERISDQTNMVIDAGFDAFVRQYWQALMTGKAMDIDYLVPSKQTTFSFRFQQASCLAGTPANAVCFTLSPVSWLVKLAVDPIVVAYDKGQQQLLRFTGRANISNAEGKYQSVDIRYQYD